MSARASRWVPAVALLLLLSACGDSRLKDLSIGINRDSVAVVMKADTPHRSESYFMEGKIWEVFYYAKPGVPAVDSIAWRDLAPVVIADGAVVGWGWDYWEREGARLRLVLPPQE
jgi:major membrane immunogen (membrane-anchored lipoprotein)